MEGRSQDDQFQTTRLFGKLTDSVPALIFYLSRDCRYVSVNKTFENWFGLSRDAIIGRSVKEVAGPEAWEKLQPYLAQALAGKTVEFEEDIPFSMGPKWVRVMYTPDVGPGGVVQGIFVLAVDVEGRRRAAEELAEAHNFLHASLDALASHIAVLDEDARILAVNEAWRRFADENSYNGSNYGIGASYIEVCEPTSGECVEGSVVADGLGSVIRGEQEYFELEYPCHSPTEDRWFLLRVTRFATPGPPRIVVSHENITARKIAEMRLQASADSFTSLVKNSPFGVHLVDSDFKIREASIGAAETFKGIEPLIGRDLAEVMRIVWPEPLASDAIAIFRRTLETGEPYVSEDFRGTRADSEVEEAYDWRTERVTLPDGTYGIVTHFYNLTAQKRLEAALRISEDGLRAANEELERRVIARTEELASTHGRLLEEADARTAGEAERAQLLERILSAQDEERNRIAMDVHDQLGQVLTGMRFNLQSMYTLVDGEAGELSKKVATLRELGERLDEEMSFLSWRLRPTVIDELGLAKALAQLVASWATHHDIEADFHEQGCKDERFDSNVEKHLYSITQEALNNAAKHAEARKVSVLLTKKNGELQLTVEDDGKGFDVNDPRTPRASGTHFGLNSMQERSSLAGGEIQIESSQGSGTTIIVRVPLKNETTS